MWVLSSETRNKLSNQFFFFWCIQVKVVGLSSQLTSGDSVLLLLQLEKLLVQLVVLPDGPSVLRPVRLQESVKVSTFLVGLAR